MGSLADSASAVSPSSAEGPPKRHDHLYLDDEPGTVVFLVQRTLFRVHPYFLKRHSPIFAGMFGLPSPGPAGTPGAGPRDVREGQSDERPIVLPATVEAVDFARLLALVYPRDVVHGDLATLEEWTSVLRIAKMYFFDDHRELAIARLAQIVTPVDRIALAREFDIPSWLEDGFFELCIRPGSLTLEEGVRLGLKDVIKIADLRQRARYTNLGWHHDVIKATIRQELRA